MANLCFTVNVDKKKQSDLGTTHAHNFRKYVNRNPPETNVDFDRTKNNKLLFGSERTLKKSNENLKNIVQKNAIRKDANVAISIVISASPEYFFDNLDLEKRDWWETLEWKNPENRKDILDVWKSLNEKKLNEFRNQVLDFAKKEYGDNIINIVEHLDEKTPHYHILVSPITKDKKLSCAKFYTPTTLRKWRNDLQERFKPLGLEAMRDELPNEPTTTKEHAQAPMVDVPKPPTVTVPKKYKLSEIFSKSWFSKNKKQIIDTEDIIKNFEKREKGIFIKYKFYKDFYDNFKFKVSTLNKTLLQNDKLKSKNDKLTKENITMKKEIVKYTKEQTDNLRAIACEDVMSSLGYSHKQEGVYARFKNDDINLNIDTTTNKFTENVNSIGGGGAIDLLVKVFDYKFSEAVSYLAENFGIDKTTNTILATDKKTVQNVVKSAVKSIKMEIPKPSDKNLQKVKDYLISKRGIDKKLIDDLISKNQLYSDQRNNCVFLSESKETAFVRGTYSKEGSKPFKCVAGKADFITYNYGSKKDKLYVFESVIEILSFKTLYPNVEGVFISTNGSTMINRVHEIADKFENVVLCFNKDEQGLKFSDKISSSIVSNVEVIEPNSKDFNEDLQKWLLNKQQSTQHKHLQLK